MPLYEYECDACGKRFEQIQQKFSDPPADVCPHCGKGPVHRLLSSPAFQFKGSGWYITDYAKKSATDSSSTGDSAGKSETSEKSDQAKTAEKSESKPAASETKTAPTPSTDSAPKKTSAE